MPPKKGRKPATPRAPPKRKSQTVIIHRQSTTINDNDLLNKPFLSLKTIKYKELPENYRIYDPNPNPKRLGLLPENSNLTVSNGQAGGYKKSPADSGVDVQTPAPSSIPYEAATSDSSPGYPPKEQTERSEPLVNQDHVKHFGLPDQGFSTDSETYNMAPVQSTTQMTQTEKDQLRARDRTVGLVSDKIKDVVQGLYDMQAAVHAYRSETETRDVLVDNVLEMSRNLADLKDMTSPTTAANASNHVAHTYVPQEVVDYVDDGRNPDIYTRELVEVVNRGNTVLNGKYDAFASFTEIYVQKLKGMGPEMEKGVDKVLAEGKDEQGEGEMSGMR